MIIEVQQYFPGYQPKIETALCESINEFYSIPFIQRWMDDPSFYQLYKVTLKTEPHLLICEVNGGKQAWLIAHLQGDIQQLPLQEWKEQ